ncbi:MAG: hypothetical protein KAJ51_04730 [Thermoplasmata archaeon]|nr:hypothetical protein [Thermoplasmata archaeon]
MSANKGFSITVKEKILLHLLSYTKYSDELEVPPAVTQQGIAQSINALRPHVSLALKDLKEQSQISERKANIQKGKRKQKVYFIEPDGMANALAIKTKAGNLKISVRDKTGIKKGQKVIDISKNLKLDLVRILNSVADDGLLDLTTTVKKPQPPVPTVAKPKSVQAPPAAPPVPPRPLPGVAPAPQPRPTVAVAVPPGHRYYQQQYPYYPYRPDYYPPEIPEWAQQRLIRNNKIAFAIGYIFIILGALFGVLFVESANFIELILGIIFFILGIVIMPVATLELWYYEDLRQYLLTLITITIFAIIIFIYFAIQEITSDAEPFIFRYETLSWFVIIGTFFGILTLGKFIPQPTRAEFGKVIGIALMIFAPVGAIIDYINMFTAIFWMIVAIAAIFVGNELSASEIKSASLAESFKSMHSSLTMGAGLGIIFCEVAFIMIGAVTTSYQYLVFIVWLAVSAALIIAPLKQYSKEMLGGLVVALPIYIAIILLFFGIFLIYYNKSIEGLIEILLAALVAGYSIRKIAKSVQNKYSMAIILLVLTAEVVSLTQILLI